MMEVKHIATLPDAERARTLLERIRSEFLPIAQARGWTVTHISEMCCCSDGMEHDGHQHGGSKRGRAKGRWKRMSDTVWGYNLSSSNSNGVCRIHIRLRHPTDHSSLIPYETVAGTMSHELAHCVHKNHSAAFYKLMDDVAEQHSRFLVRGIVVDADGFPVGGEARTLGGGGRRGGNFAAVAGGNRNGNGNGNSNGGSDLKAAVRRAAEQRSKRPGRVEPRRLGNGSTSASSAGTTTSSASIDPTLPPRDAARIAAERRRLVDSQWCLPCNEVIEILSGDESGSSDSDNDSDGGGGCKGQKENGGRTNGFSEKNSEKKRSAGSSSLAKKSRTAGASEKNSEKKRSAGSSSLAKKSRTAGATSESDNVDGLHLSLDDDDEDEDEDDAIDLTGSQSSLSNNFTFFAPPPENDGRSRERGWSCTICTRTNDALALTCRACNSVRTSGTSSLSSSPYGVILDDDESGSTIMGGWACTACTLRNRSDALACSACGKERSANGDDAAVAAERKIRRDEAVAAAKENEVRQSEEAFGGFNIYGTSKRKTATLPHLT